jgi:acyl dehydratase
MVKTRCLTTAMLEVGMQHEAHLSFTRAQVDQYCGLVGDHNAIHRDLEAARQRFPGVPDIVVPGGLIQTTISALFGTSFPGDGCLGLTFSPERFRRPVCPGDEIAVTLTVARILRGGLVEMDVRVADGSGVPLSRATARLLPADDAYHAWWQENLGAHNDTGC